ncbi:hypothetical protein [Priestia endophytica]|uniref:hypothetical protein n=1 Tax=Priestia endophytica TaxID=135735 RepID=UPI000F544ABF|nr:hypothetical protein [Priestia endophytica]RPK08311.1 hypothetical protein FH5_04941 [Priestia endophytica]
MTLIAAYSYGTNNTVFVHDFRTSSKSRELRADNAFKLVHLGKSVGLFLAGNVSGWNTILEKESTKLKEIRDENFIEQFLEILRHYATSPTPLLNHRGTLSALGFVIDDTSYSNKPFHIDYIQGIGATIEELEKNTVYLIGSGADIEGLENHLNRILSNYISDQSRPLQQKEPYLISSVLENTINTYILSLNDKSIYERKGISNAFGYSYVQNGYFEVCSYSQKEFVKDKKMPRQLIFKKDKQHNPVLVDKTNNITSKLYSLNELDLKESMVIDPFNRENS